jgi:hypothetical protein
MTEGGGGEILDQHGNRCEFDKDTANAVSRGFTRARATLKNKNFII